MNSRYALVSSVNQLGKFIDDLTLQILSFVAE